MGVSSQPISEVWIPSAAESPGSSAAEEECLSLSTADGESGFMKETDQPNGLSRI